MSDGDLFSVAKYNVVAESCDVFLDKDQFSSAVPLLPALSQEQENATQKLMKTGKELIDVASVNIEISENLRFAENMKCTSGLKVDIEMLPREDAKEISLVVSSDSVSLLQIGFATQIKSGGAVGSRLPLILDICAHKNQERNLKEQLANRKSLETEPPRKKRKKHSDTSDDEKLIKTRIRELSLSYKDFEGSPIILKYEEESSKWVLSFTLKLKFMKNKFNRFSQETNQILDLTYSDRDDNEFEKYHKHTHIRTRFIQKQFTSQILEYSKDKLSTIKPFLTRSIPDLNVNLLPFQRESVEWMLLKEGYATSISGVPVAADEIGLKNFMNEYYAYGYELIVRGPGEVGPSLLWNKLTGYILTVDDAAHLYDQYRQIQMNDDNPIHAKGVLAEEMGLGKTIEILSLILLNRRTLKGPEATFVDDENRTVTKTKSTLIICPNAILKQWLEEMELHTNALKWYNYKGYNEVMGHCKSVDDAVQKLSQYDVIVTSYNVIAAEVHHAEFNRSIRSRRLKSPKYDYSSPLALMQFYRIILDEVQMLRSSSTYSAKCTSLLHRIHTWGVSGTPIQNIEDYRMIMSYLKLHPFCDDLNLSFTLYDEIKIRNEVNDYTGNRLLRRLEDVRFKGVRFSIKECMNTFYKYDLCIRHSKADVASQINIPQQHNFIIPLEFAPIEWDNYLNLWTNFLELSGYNSDGSGSPRVSNGFLNEWLSRLRYICCHALFPEILNTRQKRLHGHSAKISNINDILISMRMDAFDSLIGYYRERFHLSIKQAQYELEISNDPSKALQSLTRIRDDLKNHLNRKFEIKDPFDISLDFSEDEYEEENLDQNEGGIAGDESGKLLSAVKGHDSNSDEEVLSGQLKKRGLRAIINLLHDCYFFLGSVYYNLGSRKLEEVDDKNQNEKTEELKYSDIFPKFELEEIEENKLLEQENYARAETLRKLILSSEARKVGLAIESARTKFDLTNSNVPLRLMNIDFDHKNDYSSNLAVSRCFKSLSKLIQALNEQSKNFNELLDELLIAIYEPVYQTEDNHISDKSIGGEEYSTSIDSQDKIFSLLGCLEIILQNRDNTLTSDSEIKIPKNLVPEGTIISKYQKQLLNNLKLISGTPLQTIFDELKNNRIVRRISTDNENEPSIQNFEDYLLQYETESKKLLKYNKQIRESLKTLGSIYNAKTEYYGQLQRISDSLVSLHSLSFPQLSQLTKTIKKSLGGALDAKINNTESRLIYLKNLSRLKDTINENQVLSCSICLGEVEVGAIIKCGHYFCKSCILTWLRSHSKCPICKSFCRTSEVYNFKFKNTNEKKEKETQESQMDGSDSSQGATSGSSTISNVSEVEKLFGNKYKQFHEINEVHQIRIKESFGAKIDFIVKLISYLRLKSEQESAEPPQVIVYSQKTEYLKVIGKVLKLYHVEYLACLSNTASVGETINDFKRRPSITCLLLNVKTLGAGLNLINAKHIFLLDPILNNSDELQAMGRNNRIGQDKETFVWNFMIKNTVEENILRYKCILEERKRKEKSSKNDSSDDTRVDVDEEDNDDVKFEISVGDQEVSSEHLWNCFFHSSH
ncbi:hypothetical protein N7582_003924 [Saccharomyces uvarum]|uniref:Irc20p n=1 Tax=Saccharomyces uvarum TaxID=230603 RepID=A0AA35J5I9_SACUV|nr:hypothetical protein N7582_003924 [Saccharomyces uvarum]CAI4046883.1 hypothetical protein SUVC_12G2890 [Saccharomyces uvarum]